MSLAFQILIVILAAAIAGLNAIIVWILSDLKWGVRHLDSRLNAHIEDREIHNMRGAAR